MAPSKLSLPLPREYKFLEVLGEGAYGKVVKCLNKDTRETVAIKLPKSLLTNTEHEISMLRKIQRLNLDKHNIVKYINCFQTKLGKALVFELMDISLYKFIEMRSSAPLLLSDIRTIIQQMATAFDKLKGIQMIHTDVKLDNIMMVNHRRRPFEVKLIDFGLAISRSEATTGGVFQPRAFRSPEIILGCPFSEAIDMWGLGCAMFEMICGHRPFSTAAETEHQIMLGIVELLGQPADRVLNNGRKTKTFFNINDDESWKIKTHIAAEKSHEFQSLDDLKEMRLEKNNKAEAVEREQCVELLKAMLKVNADERITPREVLTHPFITKDYPKNDALASASGSRIREKPKTNLQKKIIPKTVVIREEGPALTTKPPPPNLTMVRPAAAKKAQQFEVQESTVIKPPAAPLKDEDSLNIQPDDCTQSPEILASGVILVRPVTVENTTLLEDQESTVSEPPAAPLKDEDSLHMQPDDCTPSPEILASGVILDRSVTVENTTLLEDQESAVCEPPAAPLKDEDSLNIQPDDCTQSPEILASSVILVRPVTADSTTLLEDQESAVSEPSDAPLKDEDSLNIQPDDYTQSPEILVSGVILVRPVTVENTTLLEDQESTVSEPPAAPLKDEDSLHMQPDDCTQSPEILASGVILVRPVTTENTTLLEDQESAVSEPPAAPLKDEDSLHMQPDDCTQSPEILASGVILVRPVTADNTTLLEDQESAVSEPPAAPLKDEDSLNIQPDDCTQSPEILASSVILVRPVTADSTTLLEDQESAVSEPSDAPLKDEDSLNIQPDDYTQSPEILVSGVILVRPVTVENTTLLEDQESTVSEPPAAPLKDEDSLHMQPDDCTQSPEILASGVILVRPVTTENTTLLEDQESAVSEPPAAPLKDEDSLHMQPDDCTQSPEILASGVILVRPVTTENTTLLEDQESAVSEPPAAPLKDEDSLNIQPDDCTQSPEILASGVVLVRPVTAENTTLLEDQESAVSEPPAAPLKDEDSLHMQPDDCTPSPEILASGVILVRPVTVENTTLLEDQESIVSEPPAAPLKDEDSLHMQPDDCTPSPEILASGVILVRPVTVDNTTLLEDQESAVSEPPAAPLKDEDSLNIQPDDCTPSPEILASGILVRPAIAENTTLLEDQQSTVSFQSGLNKTSESSVSNTDSNTKISEDSTTCEDTGTKKKGKKKKNCFRRVPSWLRKTFSCHVSSTD